MMLRFSNTKSSMHFNLMPVGGAQMIESLTSTREKKTIQLLFSQCQLIWQCSFTLVRLVLTVDVRNFFTFSFFFRM